MSLTIQQIVRDAKRLSSKIKDHDSAADALLSQTQAVYKQMDAMKQVYIIIMIIVVDTINTCCLWMN